MRGTNDLQRGDILIIYRTSPEERRAYYSSVVTSICVVEEVKNIHEFSTLRDFLRYTSSYSVFTEEELKDFFQNKKYPTIIKFTYNLALKKRIIRKVLIKDIGICKDQYWGFIKLNENQYRAIISQGGVSENLAIH